jgi:hypothetical protein
VEVDFSTSTFYSLLSFMFQFNNLEEHEMGELRDSTPQVKRFLAGALFNSFGSGLG